MGYRARRPAPAATRAPRVTGSDGDGQVQPAAAARRAARQDAAAAGRGPGGKSAGGTEERREEGIFPASNGCV